MHSPLRPITRFHPAARSTTADGDAHRPLELVERKHQPALPRGYDNQMAGLVRRDQDRKPQLRQQCGKTFGMGTADIAKFLAGFGCMYGHWHSLESYRMLRGNGTAPLT